MCASVCFHLEGSVQGSVENEWVKSSVMRRGGGTSVPKREVCFYLSKKKRGYKKEYAQVSECDAGGAKRLKSVINAQEKPSFCFWDAIEATYVEYLRDQLSGSVPNMLDHDHRKKMGHTEVTNGSSENDAHHLRLVTSTVFPVPVYSHFSKLTSSVSACITQFPTALVWRQFPFLNKYLSWVSLKWKV